MPETPQNFDEAADSGLLQPRLVRVVAWVEIMGKRAETTFDVESPWVCPGACPELQKQTDQAVANWVFQSHAKSGFTVAPISDPNAE